MKRLSDIRDDRHVKVEKRDVRYRGHILNLVTDELALASTGSKMMREYITHDDAVAVLPIREGDGGPEVLLIRQYRHPTRSVLWEIPAGLIDKPGEDPMRAAQRELAEETGMAAAEYEFLARFYTSPGCSDELLTVYLASTFPTFARRRNVAGLHKRAPQRRGKIATEVLNLLRQVAFCVLHCSGEGERWPSSPTPTSARATTYSDSSSNAGR